LRSLQYAGVDERIEDRTTNLWVGRERKNLDPIRAADVEDSRLDGAALCHHHLAPERSQRHADVPNVARVDHEILASAGGRAAGDAPLELERVEGRLPEAVARGGEISREDGGEALRRARCVDCAHAGVALPRRGAADGGIGARANAAV